MPRNPTLSFTATPDLKEQIESIAKAQKLSRSKAIAGLVQRGMTPEALGKDEDLEVVTQQDNFEVTRKAEGIDIDSILKQLEVDKLIELFQIYHYYSENDLSPLTYCNLEDKALWISWKETGEEIAFDTTEQALLEKFFAIADEVNQILWQVDNTSHLVTPTEWHDNKDVWAISKKLVEYGLLQPYNYPGCSAYELWEFIQTHEDSADSLPRILSDAIREDRLDIVAAVLPWKPPIERGAYWHNYYSSCIGTERVKEVWQWKDNPEAHQICDELSTVLGWDKPERDVTLILDVLYENKDPFYKKESQVQQNGQFIGISFGDFLAGGKYQNWEGDRKTQAKSVFRQWHSDRLQELGQERLQRCYKLVFGCDWSVIESLTMPVFSGEWWEVLGVKPSCTEPELKRAYRVLAKQYHPDVNKSDAAKRAIQAINKAYEQGKTAIKRLNGFRPEAYGISSDTWHKHWGQG